MSSSSAGAAPALVHAPSQPSRPVIRCLRGYAFDPSLATVLDTALVSQMVYRIPWEDDLRPGPVGEYVEVVDYDPASGCFYAPVDLNHEHVLAQSGLSPSEGNPQFHQQMVYAVVMTTVDRFERALGRKALWAGHSEPGDGPSVAPRFVRRLRIYPHALRMANAYYSRNKGALLFGYFPATEDRTSGQYPGGMVFTCISHDIVAHETAHALLDGFHEHFMEPTNCDMLAFHEAFGDIVALFQHFTFPEVLRHQIAKTRGDLRSENLLAQLAAQFGLARGTRGALRDAIGKWDPVTKHWMPHEPDPTELDRTDEVHARGAILVAAVFDAFVSIYQGRTRDLLRLAANDSGALPEGELPSELVNRLAEEASKTAAHVLHVCIRALDYCPPVDLLFGEYLRALITADIDLMPADKHNYRVAFIEAFRRRGIYPQDVRTLSEDGLRWAKPSEETRLQPGEMEDCLKMFIEHINLRGQIERLRYCRTREKIWNTTQAIRRDLLGAIRDQVHKAEILQRLTGLALTESGAPPTVKLHRDGEPEFTIEALREARRQREDGRALNQVFITLVQKEWIEHDDALYPIQCGSTLVIDLDDLRVTYVIGKSLRDQRRFERTIEFQRKRAETASLGATYFKESTEIFAALHHSGA